MLKKVKTTYKLVLLLIAVVVSISLLAGCTGNRGAVARGWAGGVVKDGVLYIGSMTGDIVPVDLATGKVNADDIIPVEESEASSGFLSCGAGSAAVVMYGSPAVDDDIIYVGGYNTGKIYAISLSTQLATEEYLEKDENSSAEYIVGGPVVADDKVFIGSSDGYVYALNTVSLKTAWREPFETGDKIWSTPAVANDTVYIGSFDKKMYAINADDGSLKWEYETEGAIVATAVVEDGTLYFGSFDRYVYALDAETGDLKWKFKADNWFWAKPVIYENSLFAPSLDGKVYEINMANGEKIDEYDFENQISSSPVIVDDVFVVATQSDKKGDKRASVLHTINLKTGEVDDVTFVFDDENESVYANLTAGDGKVYAQSTLNKLYEIDVVSGANRVIDIEPETDTEE